MTTGTLTICKLPLDTVTVADQFGSKRGVDTDTFTGVLDVVVMNNSISLER